MAKELFVERGGAGGELFGLQGEPALQAVEDGVVGLDFRRQLQGSTACFFHDTSTSRTPGEQVANDLPGFSGRRPATDQPLEGFARRVLRPRSHPGHLRGHLAGILVTA